MGPLGATDGLCVGAGLGVLSVCGPAGVGLRDCDRGSDPLPLEICSLFSDPSPLVCPLGA